MDTMCHDWQIRMPPHSSFLRALPYGLAPNCVKPTKSGLSLHLDEWVELMDVVQMVNVMFLELANEIS